MTWALEPVIAGRFFVKTRTTPPSRRRAARPSSSMPAAHSALGMETTSGCLEMIDRSRSPVTQSTGWSI